MASKFEIKGNYFTVTDTVTGDEVLRSIISFIQHKITPTNQILFTDTSGTNFGAFTNATSSFYSLKIQTIFEFTDIVDSLGVAFASITALDTFLNDNLGITLTRSLPAPPTSSDNLASINQSILDAVRNIDLNGLTSAEYLDIKNSAGVSILKIRGDKKVLFGGNSVDFGVSTNSYFKLNLNSSGNTGSQVAYLLATTNQVIYNSKYYHMFRSSTTGNTNNVAISAGGLIFANGRNLQFGTSTGSKIGITTTSKLAFWAKTPIVQPTTAHASATLSGGGGTTITDTDTFDGYTLKQIVKALRDTGLLA